MPPFLHKSPGDAVASAASEPEPTPAEVTAATLSQRACVFCGTAVIPFLSTRDYNQRITDQLFRIGRCPRCDTLVLCDVPADLGEYYPRTYYATGPEPVPHPERFKLDLIQRWSPTPRASILEVGPGGGGFVGLALAAGHPMTVIDVDEPTVTRLRERYSIPGTAGDDAAALLRGLGSFDVIALWQSLEHLPRPRELLAEVPAHLSEGGILVVATPNPAALQLHVLRSRWTHIDAPRHLFLVPSPTLTAVVCETGLVVTTVTYRDAGSLGWNLFGWQMSLRNLTTHRLARRALVKVGHLIDVPARLVERRGAWGASYTLVARRPR